MNKKTTALTTEQYKEIITTMKQGGCGFRPNERVAVALTLEGNLGLRISDILALRPCDIQKDGERYHLEIKEQKTGKRREFTVPLVIQQYIENYCLRNGIHRDERIFPLTERAVQKNLRLSASIWALRESARTVFANGTQPRFIRRMGMTLPWFSGSYSTHLQVRLSDTSVLSRNA